MSDEQTKVANLRYLNFKKNVLDVQSPTMCAAKWMDATIWLYSGLTASCHHPPNHKISLEEIKENPSALHNTLIKKRVRQQMQQGVRPSECEYCWKIEDLSENSISDRVFHSLSSSFDEVAALKNLDYLANVNPKRLEIAFDRTCQFACAYCNPSYSSSWVNDIKKNGPYQGLITDRTQHYESTHANSDPYFGQEVNPYIEAFWKWWPDLKKSLQQIRVTGGEPLLTPHFWKLIEHLKNDSLGKIQLAINSNLGSQPNVIEKLIDASHYFDDMVLYTSCEAFEKQAEYIRDGLDFNLWKANVLSIKRRSNIKNINIMLTINNLCLFSIIDFLDLIIGWKSEFGRYGFTFSLNIVRWPTFHSPLVLPLHLRTKLAQKLKNWLDNKFEKDMITTYEKEHVERLIQYLESATTPTAGAASREALEKDLKRFILQYDQRRHKNYRDVFGQDMIDWMDSISIKDSI